MSDSEFDQSGLRLGNSALLASSGVGAQRSMLVEGWTVGGSALPSQGEDESRRLRATSVDANGIGRRWAQKLMKLARGYTREQIGQMRSASQLNRRSWRSRRRRNRPVFRIVHRRRKRAIKTGAANCKAVQNRSTGAENWQEVAIRRPKRPVNPVARNRTLARSCHPTPTPRRRRRPRQSYATNGSERLAIRTDEHRRRCCRGLGGEAGRGRRTTPGGRGGHQRSEPPGGGRACARTRTSETR